MRRLDSSFNPTNTKVVKFSGDIEMPGVIEEDNMKEITKNTQVNFVYITSYILHGKNSSTNYR